MRYRLGQHRRRANCVSDITSRGRGEADRPGGRRSFSLAFASVHVGGSIYSHFGLEMLGYVATGLCAVN